MTTTTAASSTPAASAPTGPRRLPSRRPLVGGVAALAVLAAGAAAGVAPLLSPAPPDQDVVSGFSTERAQADLAVVADVPHPLGSPSQAAVEEFLVRELSAMGLDPEVQVETVTMAPDPASSVWTAEVRNVVAKLEGTGDDHTDAVMLAAHYDSVPSSPGAGDNGAGVVSVLETMRVLSAGPPPRHDVIVAFIDGEEHEMLGSRAFVDSHPWIRDVRVAVNTEGVGNAGRVTPALTTERNGWALRQYLQSAPSPVVYSAFGAPLNATQQGADLGNYQEVVPAGLEFVVVGGLPAYHAGTDTAAAMHDGTLAEYGTSILALTRQLAEGDLDAVEAPDLVAFTVVRGLTLAYPSTWSLPLAVLAGLTVITAIGVAARRDRVALRRVLLAWVVLGAGALAGILAATGLWLAARAVDPRLSDALNGGSYQRTAFVLAAVSAGAAGVLLTLWPLRRRCSALEVVAGALVGWALVGLLLAALLPDAAYAATWPLLAATAGFAVLALRRPSPLAATAVATLAALPAVLLLSPLVALYFMLSARFELMLPVATPLPMLWVVLGLTVVLPLALVSVRHLSWRPAALAAAVAVGLVAVGVVVDAADDNPRPDALVYVADADTDSARWVALPPEPDAYTGQVADTGWQPTDFEASPFHQPGVTTAASAVDAPRLPAADLPRPEATVTRDATREGDREIGFTATAPDGTYALTVDVRAAGGVEAVTVDGTSVPGATSGSPDSVRVVAFSPRAAVPVTVTVPSGGEVELAMTAYRLGLPDAPALQLEPRPASLTTGVHEVTDSTVVTRTVSLGAGDAAGPE